MKKTIVIIMIVLMTVLIGLKIYKNVDKINKVDDKIGYKEDGIILEYSVQNSFGSIEEAENYYYVTLSSDKKLVWGKKISGELGNKTLSDEEFNNIISIAFTKEFKSLEKDISDKESMDGSYRYITLYYKDGTSFKTGGLNPNNKLYNKLTSNLDNLTK